VIAVADDSGRLIMLERMDGAPTISVDIAPGRPATAALFAEVQRCWKKHQDPSGDRHRWPSAAAGRAPDHGQWRRHRQRRRQCATSQQDEQVAAAGIAAIKGADEPKKP